MQVNTEYYHFSSQLAEVIQDPLKLHENDIPAFVNTYLEQINEARKFQDKEVLANIRKLIGRVHTLEDDSEQIINTIKTICGFKTFKDLPLDIRELVYEYLMPYHETMIKLVLYSDLLAFSKVQKRVNIDPHQIKPPINTWMSEIRVNCVADDKKRIEKIVHDLCILGDKVQNLNLNFFIRSTEFTEEHLNRILDACPNIRILRKTVLDLILKSELLKKLKFLSKLYLSKEDSLDFLRYTTRLTTLVINKTDKDLVLVANLPFLRKLEVVETDHTNLPIKELTDLTSLTIGKSRFTSLKDLKDFTNLKKLNLRGASRLVDITHLTALINLRSLCLAECTEITNFESIFSLTALTELKMLNTEFSDYLKIPTLKLLRTLQLSINFNPDEPESKFILSEYLSFIYNLLIGRRKFFYCYQYGRNRGTITTN